MKRRVFLATYAVALVAISCNNQIIEFECDTALDAEVERIVDGARHFNPHSVDAMREACRILYPTSRNGVDLADEIIVATHKYVRFLPANKAQMDALLDTEWELFNYPMDYEFPDSVNLSTYHDPDIPEDQITWQYTVIPINEPITDTITYQLLEECYIPDDEEEVQTSVGSVNIAQIENLSYEIASGNSESASTMALTTQTYTSTISVDGIPVKGVKVRMKRGLIVKTAYTSDSGRYSIRGKLGNSPKIEILYENKKDFKLGYGLALIMPSTTSIPYANVNFLSTNNRDWVLARMNNAAYDYYNWCATKGIPTPVPDTRIWALTYGMGGAACPMLHHSVPRVWRTGVRSLVEYLITDDMLAATLYTGVICCLLNWVGPDVILMDVDNLDAETIFRNTCHELAHSTHFTKVGNNNLSSARWWVNVVDYQVWQGLISEDFDPYGDGTHANSGWSGVTEMWAHAVELIILREVYRDQMSLYNSYASFPNEELYEIAKAAYWFKPPIVWDLYCKGMPLNVITNQLVASVTSVVGYKNRLLNYAPDEYSNLVMQTFSNYGY